MPLILEYLYGSTHCIETPVTDGQQAVATDQIYNLQATIIYTHCEFLETAFVQIFQGLQGMLTKTCATCLASIFTNAS